MTLNLPHNFRYCPVCGSTLVMQIHGDSPTPTCGNAACAFIFWQNAKPAACVLIPNQQGELLMTVRDIEPDKGLLDLPGGFLHETEEPGIGAAREVLEELGVTITIDACIGHAISTYGDNSYYVLNIGFTAHIISGSPQPLAEIASLEWVNPDTVLDQRLAFTSNADMFSLWRAYKHNL